MRIKFQVKIQKHVNNYSDSASVFEYIGLRIFTGKRKLKLSAKNIWHIKTNITEMFPSHFIKFSANIPGNWFHYLDIKETIGNTIQPACQHIPKRAGGLIGKMVTVTLPRVWIKFTLFLKENNAKTKK